MYKSQYSRLLTQYDYINDIQSLIKQLRMKPKSVNQFLDTLKSFNNTDACVSIMINTHRTHPESLQDTINLKNHAKQAVELLYTRYDKRVVWEVEKQLAKTIDDIDIQNNLDSIVVCANPTFGSYITLPLTIQEYILVDNKFATREIRRALFERTYYRILVLSKREARLLNAMNDRLIDEVKDENFPMTNPYMFAEDNPDFDKKNNIPRFEIQKFFRTVDKAVLEYNMDEKFPIVVATANPNFGHLQGESQEPKTYIECLYGNAEKAKASEIVKEAWESLKSSLKNQNELVSDELANAQNKGILETDMTQIKTFTEEGRGDKLIIQKGYLQPAVIHTEIDFGFENNPVITTETDDMIHELIEKIDEFGGRVMFADSDVTAAYAPVMLIRRY